MISRLNRGCAYFPCHKGLEDCTFCYCPFYPCKNSHLGKGIITRDKRKVWSCKDCSWIHNKNVVDDIFNMVRNNDLKGRILPNKLKAGNTGIIILGHGSNLKSANESLRRLVKEIRTGNGLDIVEPAFLQLCKPDLQKAIKKVIKKGCNKIIIVPFFLFMGNHVRRDIPKAIAKEAKIHKEVKLIYAKTIGEDPRIKSIVIDCITEAAR